jgi:4-aminobutyrate aminotransferase-like enzyme
MENFDVDRVERCFEGDPDMPALWYPREARGLTAFLDILAEENLMEKAASLGEYVKNRLLEMQKKYEIIGDVRGKGLAICIELVKDPQTKEPIDSKWFTGKMHKKGVLMVSGGVGVRICPPLVISKEMMEQELDILESVIKEVSAEIHRAGE